MKKLITTLLFVCLLAFSNSCKEDKRLEHPHPDEVHEPGPDINPDVDRHVNWEENMEMDGNNRWMANPETTEGILKMHQYVAEHKAESLEDYHTLAEDLEEQKNYIVKECTMKGASHDNLHIYLEPLMEKIENLKEVETVEEGAELRQEIREHLEAYDTYFQ